MGTVTHSKNILTVAASQRWNMSPQGKQELPGNVQKLSGQGYGRAGFCSGFHHLFQMESSDALNTCELLHFIIWFINKLRKRRTDDMEGVF